MNTLNALVAFAVIITIFLVCREMMCWYWKQNETVKLLKAILEELKKDNGSYLIGAVEETEEIGNDESKR